MKMFGLAIALAVLFCSAAVAQPQAPPVQRIEALEAKVARLEATLASMGVKAPFVAPKVMVGPATTVTATSSEKTTVKTVNGQLYGCNSSGCTKLTAAQTAAFTGRRILFGRFR